MACQCSEKKQKIRGKKRRDERRSAMPGGESRVNGVKERLRKGQENVAMTDEEAEARRQLGEEQV